MGIDLSKVRKKLNSIKNNGSKKSGFWRPQAGKQTIRIVPNKFSPDYPFMERLFYYGLNGKTYMSPASFDDPDFIFEMANKLKAQGDKESWKAGKSMSPKMRTFVPVIVRGEESEGVRMWGFGKTVYEELLSYLDEDEDYGDITDPQTGTDIRLVYTPQEESDTNFAQTAIRPVRNSSVLSDDDQQAASWLNNQPNLDEMYNVPTYEETRRLFEVVYMDGDSVEEDESPAPTRQKRQSAPAPTVKDEDEEVAPGDVTARLYEEEKTPTKVVADIENQFEALFDD